MNGVPARALVAAGLLVPTALVSGLVAQREFATKIVVAETTLPEKIGNWESRSVPLSDGEKSMLDSPAASQRVYNDPSTGDQVQVLVLQVNNTQNAHDPKLCMAGSGYALQDDHTVQCPWGAGYPVSRADFQKDSSRVSMYYWLRTPTGSIADMSSGLKMEGLKRALVGSTLKGLAIRVIALPHSTNPAEPTDPKVAENLWKTLENQIRPDTMIARM